MNDFTFIINPKAGKGAAGRRRAKLLDALRAAGFRQDLLLTEGPGHATTLARESGTHTVVAIGGDGTVNEVANGIIGSGRRLGIVPVGSGNDLIKSVSIPHDVGSAIRTLIRGKTREIDVGVVSTEPVSGMAGSVGTNGDRAFLNGVGAGFDAAVAVRTREIPFLRGTALYLLAVLQTLGRYTSPLFDVDIDGRRRTTRNLLMAVGNGACAGGGFFLTPDAVVDDGRLDLCLIEKTSIPQILRLMPRVLRGAHHGVRQVTFDRGIEVRIASAEPFFVHADGEIVGRNVRSLVARLSGEKLPVIVQE